MPSERNSRPAIAATDGAVAGGPQHVGLARGQRRVAGDQAVGGQRRVDDAQPRVHPAYGVGELRAPGCP